MEHEVGEAVLLDELFRVAATILEVTVEAQNQNWRHNVQYKVLDCSVRVEMAFAVAVFVRPHFVFVGVGARIFVLPDINLVRRPVNEDRDEQIHAKHHKVDYVTLVLGILGVLHGQAELALPLSTAILILRIVCIEKTALSLRQRCPGHIYRLIMLITFIGPRRQQRLVILVWKRVQIMCIDLRGCEARRWWRCTGRLDIRWRRLHPGIILNLSSIS